MKVSRVLATLQMQDTLRQSQPIRLRSTVHTFENTMCKNSPSRNCPKQPAPPLQIITVPRRTMETARRACRGCSLFPIPCSLKGTPTPSPCGNHFFDPSIACNLHGINSLYFLPIVLSINTTSRFLPIFWPFLSNSVPIALSFLPFSTQQSRRTRSSQSAVVRGKDVLQRGPATCPRAVAIS